MASERDKRILDMMFDPFLLETGTTIPCDPEPAQPGEKAKVLEIKAVELANKNEFDQSLVCFQRALELWPTKASIWNNRAQVYRLMNQIQEAKANLDEAIKLSEADRSVARQAYCQRALIHLLEEDKQKGLQDMTKAAELGNRFASSYLAKMNPYAALCNKMLKEMFQEFQIPYSEDS